MANNKNTQAQAQAQSQAQALVDARENAVKTMDELTRIDFQTSCNIDVVDKGKAGIKPIYTMTYVDKDKDGNEIVTKNEITDPDTVANLVRLDKLTQAGRQAGIGTCYILSKLAENKDLLHVKSMDEFGKLYGARYGIKAKTATQYARVGKYFVNMQDNGNGANYFLRSEVAGASITNLVQVLSLTDDNLEDPCEPIWNAIAENKIHLDGTLARLKDELQKMNGKALENKDENKTASAGKGKDKAQATYSDCLSTLLSLAKEFKDDERRNESIECIARLESIFNAENKDKSQDENTQAQDENENENE